jgi:ketopantoate reductase
MKILVVGAGVIGTTYAWQLSNAGQEVVLFVREGKREKIQKDGIRIKCKDERQKQSAPTEVVYHPTVISELASDNFFDLILVSVRAHQLDDILPLLAEYSGNADILFFSNNWWGDQRISKFLHSEKYLFGFSRLVGGWRTEEAVECIIFDNPELVTMLGERDG